MRAIPLFCHKDTGELRYKLANATPSVRLTGLLGTLLELSVTFFDDDNAAVELSAGTTGSLECRAVDALDGDSLLLDSSWDHATGSTLYTLKTLADSVQLRAVLGTLSTCIISAQLAFTLPDEDVPRKSLPFELNIINGPARGDAGYPDTVGAAQSMWLTARAPRIDTPAALTAGQRTQLLTNIGNMMQQRLSDDGVYLHLYTPAGIYKGSVALIDLGQADL